MDQESVPDYWNTDPIISMPFYSGVMPRDMFFNILSFLHLSDNQAYIPHGRPGYQPLTKLGRTYDLGMSLIAPCLNCGRKLSVDNNYTSPELFFYAHSTGATGTARAHRKNMSNVKDVQLKDRGDRAIVHIVDL